MNELQRYKNYKAQLEREAANVFAAQAIAMERGAFEVMEGLDAVSERQMKHLLEVDIYIRCLEQMPQNSFLTVAPALIGMN